MNIILTQYIFFLGQFWQSIVSRILIFNTKMFLWRTPIQPNYDEDQKKSIKMIKIFKDFNEKFGIVKKTIVKKLKTDKWKWWYMPTSILIRYSFAKIKKFLTTIFMIWKTFWAGIYLISNFCSLNRRNRDVPIVICLLHFWWLRKIF